MKQNMRAAQHIKLRFWKKALSIITLEALLILMMGSASGVNAQPQIFTFMGDYDLAFGGGLGYYVDPQDPDPTAEEYQLNFYTGELLADGSTMAGGRFVTTAVTGDFYLRKLTPTGAVDTSFGTNGLVRTNFYTDNFGVPSNELPAVVKVQPDGKILFAGDCRGIRGPDVNAIPAFGDDACVVRYNPNGTIDTSFGNSTIQTGGGQTAQGIPAPVYEFQVGAGRFTMQTGLIIQPDNPRRGTGGKFYDIAIQPDGKIILVGETSNFYINASGGNGGIIVRLNPNGTLDATFGTGGVARWNAPQGPVANCYPGRGLNRVRLQADGRIIAVGYDEITRPEDCFVGKRFAVTRWTSGGQLETVRHLDNPTNVGLTDHADGVIINRDVTKVMVSGRLDGLATMARLNLSDLSIDTTFGTGGIKRYDNCGNVGTPCSGTLYIKAIQPDGRIIGLDTDGGTPMVRFNPDGSPDLSFGNPGQPGGVNGGRGRLRLNMLYYTGATVMFTANHILQRPNGRTVFLGAAAQRAAVSQQNTTLENGIYSDFENDGKTDFSVFRNGTWYWLNSANNQFNGVQFGTAGDKPAPADYDGDGRTDIAVFRNGAWYILRSSNSQFTGISFGAAGDLPRPGDFDGDGKADVCVWRPSTGTWYMLRSSDGGFNAVQFGQNGDVPLLADFDGDGRSDISVYRNGTWYWLRSSDNGFASVAFGQAGDIPVIGDYDADSKFDPAVFRPSNGTWYQLRSQSGFSFAQFGQNGDVPVPGDYDNDGKHDLAVYRGGNWYVLRSGDSSVAGAAFGSATDVPVPAAYLP